MNEFKVYIANLKEYCKGEMLAKWINLPTDKDTLENLLNRINVGKEGEGYLIADYENDLCVKIEKNSDLWENVFINVYSVAKVKKTGGI